MRTNPKKNPQRKAQKKDFLPGLSERHLECRSYRSHAFDSVGYFYWKTGRGKGICRVSVCVRCDTYREDYLYSNGTLAMRKYTYPENYNIIGEGVLKLADVRKEVLRRVEVIHASPDDLPVPARRSAGTRRATKKNLVRGVASA